MSLLVLSPISPARSGNGLAMRVFSFLEAVRPFAEPVVAVVPIFGKSMAGDAGGFEVVEVRLPEPPLLRRQTTRLLADERWRALLGALEPLPRAAQMVPPSLAEEVLRLAPLSEGTPLHVVRSYMAPLGLALADRLGSSWSSLDLDDDDEAVAGGEADRYSRLVAGLGPLFSTVALASPSDADRVAARHGFSTFQLPNVVAVPGALPTRCPAGDMVAFVGNLTYWPNIEAALTLADEVLPALRAELGRKVTAHLVGPYSKPGPLEALQGRADVVLTGFVPDLGEIYDRADAVVAPLRSGSGTRLKLLEAFAAGVPVVTTPLGAAGLSAKDGEHLLLSETSQGLASHVARLMSRPELGPRLAASAFELVNRCYSPSMLERRVGELVRSAQANGRPSF